MDSPFDADRPDNHLIAFGTEGLMGLRLNQAGKIRVYCVVLSIVKFYFLSSPKRLFPNLEAANTMPTVPAHQARPRGPGLGCTACGEHWLELALL
jgi:hypothetical protein